MIWLNMHDRLTKSCDLNHFSASLRWVGSAPAAKTNRRPALSQQTAFWFGQWGDLRTHMKKLFAIAVAACVTLSAAFAAPLSDNQGKFIVLYLITMLADHDCRQMDYSLKKDGLQRFQDELGLDDRTKLAVVAAAQLISGQEYNRSDLIPEVTQLAKGTLKWLSQE